MIFESISTFLMNRCNILQTETRQEKPETETEIETETCETPCTKCTCRYFILFWYTKNADFEAFDNFLLLHLFQAYKSIYFSLYKILTKHKNMYRYMYK